METESAERNGAGGDVLEVKHLKMHFPIKQGFFGRIVGHVKAVDDVDLKIRRGETLGLVGESGCGKTTLGRCIVRSYEPTEGEMVYHRDGARRTSRSSAAVRSSHTAGRSGWSFKTPTHPSTRA